MSRGKAVRAPNYAVLYDKDNPVDFGNRDLKVEDVHTLEVGYTQTISRLTARSWLRTEHRRAGLSAIRES